VPLYYCLECAIKLGHLRPALPAALTGTHYQLEKYIKHTAPTSAYNFSTVFTSPGSETYRNYIITAVSSGHVQIDDRGRKNVVWVGSEQTGLTYSNGVFVGPTNAVKVVFHDNAQKIHGFPIHSSEIKAAACVICERPVPY